MNKIYNYDINKYNFIKEVTQLFQIELSYLHKKVSKEYKLFTEIGKDTNTEFHDLFYSKLRTNWSEIKDIYKKFIIEKIYDICHEITGETEFAYQTFPTFRIMLPNNVAVTKFHYDSDSEHKHPENEINFVIAITDMFDTNTIWCETEPNKKNFFPL